MYPPHDNRPSTKSWTPTSLDFNMFVFLISSFHTGEVLSIYIMTLNTLFVFQTKNYVNSDQRKPPPPPPDPPPAGPAPLTTDKTISCSYPGAAVAVITLCTEGRGVCTQARQPCSSTGLMHGILVVIKVLRPYEFIVINNYSSSRMGSESIAHEAEGRMGY